MLKNVAGQTIGAQMQTPAGEDFIDAVAVVVTVDDGVQGGGGAATHKGNGYHSYTPSQAETDGDHVAFTFTGSGAKSETIQSYPESGSSISYETTQNSDEVTIGIQTGTAANTEVQDGVSWVLTSVAAGIDAKLDFNIGSNGDENPGSFFMWGNFNSDKNEMLQIQAFNFAANAWENLGAVFGKQNTALEIVRGLGRRFVRRGQVGTPGVNGDVRIRFLYDLSVSSKVTAGDDLNIDKAAVFASRDGVTQGELISALLEANPNRNYPDSAIVIDTENGQPGRKFGLNGTPGNAVNNLVDARALADEAGFAKYIVKGNSVLVLAEAHTDWEWILATGVLLNLNGQDVDDSSFTGGILTGVAGLTTSSLRVNEAVLDGLTAWGVFRGCLLPLAPALTANGPAVYLIDCDSVKPGAVNPLIDGGLVPGLSLSVVKYAGGIDIQGLADNAEVTISATGSFGLVDAASTATVIASGNSRQVGGLPTNINLIQTARIDQGQVGAAGMAAGDIDGKNHEETLRLLASDAAGSISTDSVGDTTVTGAGVAKPRIQSTGGPGARTVTGLDTTP